MSDLCVMPCVRPGVKGARLGTTGGLPNGRDPTNGGHVQSPDGALTSALVVLVLGVTLTACAQGEGGRTAEFVGPNVGELTVGYGATACNDEDESAPRGSDLSLGAEGFTPDTPISLRWSVQARDLNGSWDSVVASDEGSLDTTVTLPKADIQVGDEVEVWAEGNSKEGLLAISKEVPIGSC